LTISPHQRQLFQDWLVMAQQAISTAQATASKQILKSEFDRIKPDLLKKLESAKSTTTLPMF
jgi:eukaryotic-like serine/threonine-protein kinase